MTARLSEKVLGDFAGLSVFMYGPRMGGRSGWLPPCCRQVVTMRKVEGLHENEVAKQMGNAVEWSEDQKTNGMWSLARTLRERHSALASHAPHGFVRTSRHVG